MAKILLDEGFFTRSNKDGYIDALIELKPTLGSPLPNVDLCDAYCDLLKEKCLNNSQVCCIPLYRKIGAEVLRRNKYVYNSRVSALNGKLGPIRDIYSACGTKGLYASIDVENGEIEICDYRGRHQDAYTYDNKAQGKQDKKGNHDIKV